MDIFSDLIQSIKSNIRLWSYNSISDLLFFTYFVYLWLCIWLIAFYDSFLCLSTNCDLIDKHRIFLFGYTRNLWFMQCIVAYGRHIIRICGYYLLGNIFNLQLCDWAINNGHKPRPCPIIPFISSAYVYKIVETGNTT